MSWSVSIHVIFFCVGLLHFHTQAGNCLCLWEVLMGVICIDIKLASFIVDLWDFFFSVPHLQKCVLICSVMWHRWESEQLENKISMPDFWLKRLHLKMVITASNVTWMYSESAQSQHKTQSCGRCSSDRRQLRRCNKLFIISFIQEFSDLLQDYFGLRV